MLYAQPNPRVRTAYDKHKSRACWKSSVAIVLGMMKCCLLALRGCCIRQSVTIFGNPVGTLRRQPTRTRSSLGPPNEAGCRMVQNPILVTSIRRLAWSAAGLRSFAIHCELYKVEKHRTASRSPLRRPMCRVFSPASLKSSQLSLSCGSGLKKSISAPRSRTPESFAVPLKWSCNRKQPILIGRAKHLRNSHCFHSSAWSATKIGISDRAAS